jgi:hypothetical protein
MNRSGINLCSALQQWPALSRHLWLQRRNYKAAMPVQLLSECCTPYLHIHDFYSHSGQKKLPGFKN